MAEAESLRRGGRYREALTAFERVAAATRVDPSNRTWHHAALLGQARAALLIRRPTEAKAALDALGQDTPSWASTAEQMLTHAAVLEANGDWNRAAETYKSVASGDLAGVAGVLAAEAWIKGENWPRATTELERVRRDEVGGSTWDRVQDRLIEARTRSGDLAGVVRAQLELAEGGQTPARRADAALKAGGAFVARGEVARGQELLLRVVRLYPIQRQAVAALTALDAIDRGTVNGLERGLVLFHAGQYAAAERSFTEHARSSAGERPTALLFAARAARHSRGVTEAIQQLDSLADDRQAGFMAVSLMEAGRLLAESGQCSAATRYFERVVKEHADSSLAPEATFRLGRCRDVAGDSSNARTVWSSAAKLPVGEWQARSLYALGKGSGGGRHTVESAVALVLASSAADTYYAARAREMLLGRGGTQTAPRPAWRGPTPAPTRQLEDWLGGWAGDPGSLTAATSALGREPAFIRAEELRQAGLLRQAQTELRDLVEASAARPWQLAAIAVHCREVGLYSPVMVAGMRLLAASPAAGNATLAPRAVRELAFPMAYPEALASAAERHRVDPLLLLALVRQESWLNPLALSVAEARGLTQVIPSTAAGIAGALGHRSFAPDDLYQPDVSLDFGAWYLASQLRAHGGNLFYTLAAYNAGAGNAARWLRDDPDAFVEGISFRETEEYLRKVYVNFSHYRELYGEGGR
ncbi:MAG: transglycosylase SLT domain-containing protein [Chloroflexi bacterium]|nr:transglycosylase SLT domain-containing protein [Chloroflexota bacterium]